ncbi:hypothetical protein LLB_1157 [Legionella longbeachae D-4968]|nr:hypothetical protein LLB_1157 [Legionella longbeachae D-4968]
MSLNITKAATGCFRLLPCGRQLPPDHRQITASKPPQNRLKSAC